MEIIKVFFKAVSNAFLRLIPVSQTGSENIFNFLYTDLTKKGIDSLLPILIKFAVIIALIWHLREELKNILKETGKMLNDIIKRRFKLETDDKDKNTVLMLLLAMISFIFTPVFTFLFAPMLDNFLITTLAFILSGIFIYLSESKINKKPSEKNEVPLNALSVGLFKVLSVIPGFSSIGGMYFACAMGGFRKEFSFKFIYLLTLIATFISLIIDITGLFTAPSLIYGVFSYIPAFIGALFASYYAVCFLNYTVRKNYFKYFGLYNIIFGIFILIIWLRG